MSGEENRKIVVVGGGAGISLILAAAFGAGCIVSDRGDPLFGRDSHYGFGPDPIPPAKLRPPAPYTSSPKNGKRAKRRARGKSRSTHD